MELKIIIGEGGYSNITWYKAKRADMSKIKYLAQNKTLVAVDRNVLRKPALPYTKTVRRNNMTRLLLAILTITIAACEHKTSKPTCDIQSYFDDFGTAAKYGYQPYHDIDIARQCSKQIGRPILLMFTGWSSYSISGLEWELLIDKDVKTIIDNNYILTVLYVDDQTPLDNIDTTEKTVNGRVIKTIGQKNANLQLTHFDSNFQPCYIIVDSDLNKIAGPIGYTPSNFKDKFIDQLKQGLKE